jgi:hypothetical protein
MSHRTIALFKKEQTVPPPELQWIISCGTVSPI